MRAGRGETGVSFRAGNALPAGQFRRDNHAVTCDNTPSSRCRGANSLDDPDGFMAWDDGVAERDGSSIGLKIGAADSARFYSQDCAVVACLGNGELL